MQKKPILTVFAGPNGSGKSTVTSKYPLPEYYVNADEIERQCNCTQLEAAKIAENTREYLLAQKESFAFETVLSTDRNINLIRRAKAAGYYIVVSRTGGNIDCFHAQKSFLFTLLSVLP